jgi:hypothetical protein
MELQSMDFNTALMLDGNAVAGLLHEIFNTEMTVVPICCASCGREGELGSLQAYMHGPGVVLRCPACEQIVLRIVQTPRTTYLDARGTVYLYIPRQS